MGCSSSKLKKRYWNLKINLPLDKLLIEKLNKVSNNILYNFNIKHFKNSSMILDKGESLRAFLANKWVQALKVSGAIVLLNPDFVGCVEGMVWKLYTDHHPYSKDIITSLKFDCVSNENPLYFKKYDQLTDESKIMIKSLNTFIISIISYHDKIDTIIKMLKEERKSINIELVHNQDIQKIWKLTKQQT